MDVGLGIDELMGSQSRLHALKYKANARQRQMMERLQNHLTAGPACFTRRYWDDNAGELSAGEEPERGREDLGKGGLSCNPLSSIISSMAFFR